MTDRPVEPPAPSGSLEPRPPGDAPSAPASPPDGPAPVVEIRGVSKRFGSTQALDDVSLVLLPGEIHALLGENGAGKSTLIKVMTGVVEPDAGEVLVDGRRVEVRSALEAQALGIAAIYQEPMIFPDLSVAENIFIGHRDRGRIVDRRKMRRDAEAILGRLGVRLDVDQPARGLTLAEQQTVEIAKALSLRVRVLIMDEPTASLSAHEVRRLFGIVEALRREGVAILFISHRMEEVFEIADRITILRDGRVVSTGRRGEFTPERAIRDMVGRKMTEFFTRTPAPIGDVVLEVRGLRREGAFEGITFAVRSGEVLGFAGLVGARRTDVGLALFGIAPADGGEILLDGRPVAIRSPQDALRLGIAYVTEDRKQFGLVPLLSIAANISLPSLRRYLGRLGLVRREAETATAREFMGRLRIRAPSADASVAVLSGGNQQKVVLSKWLNTRPRVLILDEPTRGIDVGAKADVHQIIDQLAHEGIAIVLISSDLPEVLAMSDRILVMREGRQMAILERSEATQERVLAAAMGQPVLAGPLAPAPEPAG
ncbi:MAG TPA: sugar ABC transporter ATP-binding protein [Candidatus Limnocylindrales bacterium]|nr:sugar ABC transporter ATP-binding protein [Candidatus Limnocylindrales bacterium]